MKLKLEFHGPTKDHFFTQKADMEDGHVVVFGPLKVGISLEGGPVKDVEGFLHISEDRDMIAEVGVEASEATLTVRHGEET